MTNQLRTKLQTSIKVSAVLVITILCIKYTTMQTNQSGLQKRLTVSFSKYLMSSILLLISGFQSLLSRRTSARGTLILLTCTGWPKNVSHYRASSLNRIKIVNQARFFTNFDNKISIRLLYVRIKYSMNDLICYVSVTVFEAAIWVKSMYMIKSFNE